MGPDISHFGHVMTPVVIVLGRCHQPGLRARICGTDACVPIELGQFVKSSVVSIFILSRGTSAVRVYLVYGQALPFVPEQRLVDAAMQ